MPQTETDRPALESADSFKAYCEGVKQQLQSFVIERIQFLESAQADLSALEALAVKAGDDALRAELLQLRERAAAEHAALRSSEGAALIREIAAQTAPAAAAVVTRAEPANNGSQTVWVAPQAAAPTRSTPSRPSPPPVPATAQRPLEEIYKDTDSLTELAEREGDVYGGKTGLIRLKGLLCRQRALQAELASRDIQHWPLRSLLNYIRRRIDDEHGPGHYLIPLRAELYPVEAWPWNMLADLYENLADAHVALDWYDAESSKFTKTERQELLECIASHQTRLWRHLQTYFPRQNDEHQIQFFRELCAIAEEEDIYLFTLQERCPDDELTERAEHTPVVLENLRLDKKNRAKREAALQTLRALVSNPDFGTRETDPDELTEAVAKCRSQGAPASSIALRTLLMPWVSLLEESQDKSVQEVARELQKESERLQRKAVAELAEAEPVLSESEQAELEAVRAVTRGKKLVFIGGICREEARQKLQRELELESLVWPSTNGTESVYKFEADIQNTDITVIMVRFMRTGWGQARELALRHEKLFARLPSGYGLNQVVRQFYRQLVHEDAPAAVLA